MGRFLFILGSVLLVSACKDEERSPRAEQTSSQRSPREAPRDSPPVRPHDECARRIEGLIKEEGYEGARGLEEHRAEILARARSVPVVFLRTPRAPQGASQRVLDLRKQLRESQDPAQTVFEIIKNTSGLRELRREVFLSEGYLYAESPHLALRLSQILRLDHLFSEQELVIKRGGGEIVVTRDDGRYWLPSTGPEEEGEMGHGAPASILLFDQIRSASAAPDLSIHVDLEPLQRSLGFSSARVLHMSDAGLVLALSTYGLSSEALISVKDSVAILECETPGETPIEHLHGARELALSNQELVDPILAAAHEIIRRGLPFDEPKTEEGQQDGLLRIHFQKAYRDGKRSYEFNGDKYFVFDGFGRPRLPQVCIDFITDAFDWGTGGRWPHRGEKTERVKGALNFASLGIENPRSIESLASFATQTPEWFDMVWLDKGDQVKFIHREKFFAALLKDADRYRRGDVIFIFGLRDDEKFHFHSFLIDQKDPLTGIPMIVAANAGPPQLRTWEGEMANAPLRSIVARMRVRRDILLLAKKQAQEHPGIPLAPPERASETEKAPTEGSKVPG